MPLVQFVDMVGHACRHNYAVGAFGVDDQAMLEGVLQAAEDSRAPVILNLVESHFVGRDFELFAPTVVVAARRAAVPVAINFDHGSGLASAERAIAAGCNVVMVDASMQAFYDNLHQTREVAAMAHACGVAVEGELGYVPGAEGESADEHPGELAYTSAAEARAYVERSGVDCLAVSIGTVHGRMKGAPKLDYNRLAKIHAAVGVPLVIHGGTGLSEEQYRRLISHGVAKINYYTGLAEAAARRIRANAAASGSSGYAALQAGVRDAVREEVERCIRAWGSGGRAAEVLGQCRPWQEAAHVALLHAPDAQDGAANGRDIAFVLREGREALQRIPCVRDIRVGQAMGRVGQAMGRDGQYQYCLLVTLASTAAIAAFQDHPALRALTGKTRFALDNGGLELEFAELQ
jgi:fructose-bisphosphate aldolase class II